jgi:hypothetical protein
MGVIDDRITELGLVLPPPLVVPIGVVLPFSFVRVVGDRALFSGHGPQAADGSVGAPFGQVGTDVTVEQAYESARSGLRSARLGPMSPSSRRTSRPGRPGWRSSAAFDASSATSIASPDGRDCSGWSTRHPDSGTNRP